MTSKKSANDPGEHLDRPSFTLYTSALLKKHPEASKLEPLTKEQIKLLADRLHKKLRAKYTW